MHPIICLMGPTATGKTELAIKLVQQFPFEIISVDSAMVYRGMDIGTAKPNKEILDKAPHRLINIRDPSDPYSAADFCRDATFEIEEIIKQNHIPLLVGGTMLYFRALQKGLSMLPSANTDVRKQITATASQLGWHAMHEWLAKIDPMASKKIHPNDRQRIQRALEVYQLTGKNLSTEQQKQNPIETNYQFYNIALAPVERAILHARIAARFKKMLKEGLIEEVKQLQNRSDLTMDMPAIRSVGYRQVWEYLLGQFSYEEMECRGIIATRQLAKRQLTWLRSWQNLTSFDCEAKDLDVQIFKYLHSIILV